MHPAIVGAILLAYICIFILYGNMLSPSILNVSSYAVRPNNNRRCICCAIFSMLKQAKSKVDFIETMWQKTSRGQSPSAWKCFRLCGLRLCKTAVW